MLSGNENSNVEELLAQNAELLEENNELLKKLHRNAVWSFWIKAVWLAVIVGLPIVLYYVVLEPYVEAFGASYENFLEGLNQLPGFQGIDQMLRGGDQ